MKKIKLFALAVMAMLSTNAFAFDHANRTFTYSYTTDVDDAAATILGFVDEFPADEMETVTIPGTVKSATGKTLKVTTIAADAFKDNKNIKTVIFASANLTTINAAFSGCTALTSVNFASATGLTTIAAGAFAGCPFEELDLSKTAVATIENLFGTDFDNADATKRYPNTTLKSVKLGAVWTTIKEEAFAGCTALASVDFGTAKTEGTGAIAAQAFEATKTAMFAGCPLTALDFTGTLVTTVPKGLLYDGVIYKNNTTLKTVTLTKTFVSMNAAFSNCTALESVTGHVFVKADKTLESALVALANDEFRNDAKLTSFDLGLVATIGTYAFASTGLTSITFPKDQIKAIPEGCFLDCSDLVTVKWDAAETKLETIAAKAFANTGIAEITLPKGAVKDADNSIAANAFAFCASLKKLYWEPTTVPTNTPINVGAFASCSDIIFYTTEDYKTAKAAPTNTTYNTSGASAATGELEATAFKDGSGKYYIKLTAEANLAIDKTKASVYDAYADATNDDGVLNIISYKSLKGFYQIKAGDVCLIISDLAKVPYSTGTGTSSSMADKYDATGKNALKMLDADQSYASYMIDNAAKTAAGQYFYGWVNSASYVGFKKITSGKTLPAGTLFAWAKPNAAGRLVINWIDEDGNLEEQTTAINGIENKAAEANGQKYNLGGQKVNASYKGVIIKDGKKYIQK